MVPFAEWRISDDLILVPGSCDSGTIADGRKLHPVRIRADFSATASALTDLRQLGWLSDPEVQSALPQPLFTVLRTAGILRRREEPPPTPDDDPDSPNAFSPQTPSINTYLTLNQYCNLRCIYCLEGVETYRSREFPRMAWATARQAVEFLSRRVSLGGHHGITFFGGEPLLSWDLVKQVMAHCSGAMRESRPDLGFGYTIQTNLTFLPEDFIELAQQNALRVVASIDGPEEIHNHLRPARGSRNSYRQTVGCLERLRAAGIPFALRSTVTALNVDHLNDIEQLHLSLGASESGFGILRPVNSDAQIFGRELYPDPARFAHAIMQLINAGSRAGRRFLDEYAGRAHDFESLSQACNAASIGIPTVDVKGVLYPCSWFLGNPALAIGDVHQERYDLNAIRRVARMMAVGSDPVCSTCEYRHVCAGGCSVTRVLGEIRVERSSHTVDTTAADYARAMQCAITKTVVPHLLQMTEDVT